MTSSSLVTKFHDDKHWYQLNIHVRILYTLLVLSNSRFALPVLRYSSCHWWISYVFEGYFTAVTNNKSPKTYFWIGFYEIRSIDHPIPSCCNKISYDQILIHQCVCCYPVVSVRRQSVHFSIDYISTHEKDEFEWYGQMYCMILIRTIIPYI